ncbi:MAG TPA: hypothetical protein VIL85_08770 [Thermomicrobiales bacterium]|jgi:NAD-dependent oxidoreductase involved in siderophore biosynthesis
MTINEIMAALVAELTADGVPAPLQQSFTLAAVWQDLARLAGEPLPVEAAAVVEDTLGLTIEPVLLPPFTRGAAAWLLAD